MLLLLKGIVLLGGSLLFAYLSSRAPPEGRRQSHSRASGRVQGQVFNRSINQAGCGIMVDEADHFEYDLSCLRPTVVNRECGCCWAIAGAELFDYHYNVKEEL